MKTPTSTMRVTSTVQEEVTRLSKLCGEQPAELLERAREQYLLNHRGQFATDLEQAAELVDQDVFDAAGDEDEDEVAALLADATEALARTREAGLLVER